MSAISPPLTPRTKECRRELKALQDRWQHDLPPSVVDGLRADALAIQKRYPHVFDPKTGDWIACTAWNDYLVSPLTVPRVVLPPSRKKMTLVEAQAICAAAAVEETQPVVNSSDQTNSWGWLWEAVVKVATVAADTAVAGGAMVATVTGTPASWKQYWRGLSPEQQGALLAEAQEVIEESKAQ